MAWQIAFFEKDNGECPIQMFLDHLPQKGDLAVILNAMKQLEEHGNQLSRPHAAYLGDKIYELRVRVKVIQYRFLYFFFLDNIIVMTHGIVKKSQKVPEHEIKKARQYREIYFRRKGTRCD